MTEKNKSRPNGCQREMGAVQRPAGPRTPRSVCLSTDPLLMSLFGLGVGGHAL